MTTVIKPEPTEDELRAAWAYCRRSSLTRWPATYEEAMADATLSRLVRLNAMHPPRRAAAAPIPAPRPQQRARSATGWLPGAAPVGIDRKRAAAGDRDDD